MWPKPCYPTADTGESRLASVHSRSIRGPERGHLCCIDQKGAYSPLQPIRAECVCACVWESENEGLCICSLVQHCGWLFFFYLNLTASPSLLLPLKYLWFLPFFTPVASFFLYYYLASPPQSALCSLLSLSPLLYSLHPSALSSPTSPLPPLPQTGTHRISSNLAMCPWVLTVAKAYCGPFFVHSNLYNPHLLCNFLAEVCGCIIKSHGMHCLPQLRLITLLFINCFYYFLALLQCFSVQYWCKIEYPSISSADVTVLEVSPSYSADTAVQPSPCKFYLPHLFLELLASMGRVCGTCLDANSNTEGHQFCLATDQVFFTFSFYKCAWKVFN